MKQPAVHILASRRNGTLYAGVTSHLPQRVWEHENDIHEGFTRRYGVHLLVYYELHGRGLDSRFRGNDGWCVCGNDGACV